jgi:methionine aminotransferase
MPKITSKLPDVGTTIFTVMSQLAAEHNAINLAQGFPDFSAPGELLDRVNHHLQAGNNQYAPMSGAPELLEQVALKLNRSYDRNINANTEITITSGATEALYSAITAYVHPGDEVIVFDPAYDSYDPAIRLSGGHAVHIPLHAPDFKVDWNRVAAAINPKTRMIVINTPHNPTGTILTADDIAALTELVRDTQIILLSDEVYEHIIFDDQRHESLMHYDELADRSVMVYSFGKTFHATGWKIGYCVANEHLMKEFRKIHQYVQFCVATPLQLGLADYLANNTAHYEQLDSFYAGKRDRFVELMAKSRFAIQPSAGTYFQMADYSAISQLPDTDFCNTLTTQHGVAAIPISVFYADPPKQNVVRFCFAKNTPTLEQAAEILCAI